jgi:hypothetical protein
LIAAILITLVLFIVCGAVHYGIMSALHKYLLASNLTQGLRLQIGLIGVACAHIFETGLYAVGFKIGQGAGLGSFKGTDGPLSFMDVFYFSLVNYTSLGLGDIYPTGHLRFIAGAELLNGFLLISCSAAFLFMVMQDKDPQNAER